MKRILLSAVMAFAFVAFASAQTTYFSEDFEAGVPADWVVEGDWAYGLAGDLGSAYMDFTANTSSFLAFNDDALGENHVGSGRVETGAIDLTLATSAYLEFNLYFRNLDYQGNDETFKTSVSLDDGETWEELKNYEGSGWGVQFFDLAAYVGQSLKLAFIYDDGGTWNYGAAFDNVTIGDTPINFVRRNYTMTVNGGSQFSTIEQNIEYAVQGGFYNGGYEPVTSFDITIMQDGVPTTTTFDGFSLGLGEGMQYELEDKLSIGENNMDVMVSISNVNGDMGEDDLTEDNSASIAFAPVAVHPDRAVVVEEGTGTWCQWCPRGTVYLDEMSKRFPNNFIGIAVHNADPMVLTAYDDAIGDFIAGYPQVVYNRNSVLDPGEIIDPSLSDMVNAPELTVEMGAESNNGSLTSNVRVRFADENAAANHNITIVLTEDDLSSDEGGWNQVNRYGLGDVGAMGGFEFLPTSVPSGFWPYSHVGRALIGGFAGVNGVVGNFAAGESIIVEMGDFTMDADWKMENMHMIAIVTDGAGEVINAKSEKLNDAIANGLLSPGVATTEVYDASLASVSPNPATDFTNVEINIESASDVSIQVIDMMGQLVSKRNLGTVVGKQNVAYDVTDLAAGNYIFKVNAGDKVATQKVSVIK